LTFDLEHLQRKACDVIKLCNKFERNRAIRGLVIAILVFSVSWYIKRQVIKVYTKFERFRAIRRWIINNFANFAHTVTLWP